MSFQAMAWAVQQDLPMREKMVLLMLANYASNERGDCYPSISLLAKDCGAGKDTIIRAIKTLEDGGYLTIKRRQQEGVNLPNTYTLNMQGVVANCDHGSRSQQGGVVASCDSNLSVEPITSSLRSDVLIKSVDQEFENKFWPAYPRKVGKGQALKAYRTARKQVDLEIILAGLSRYVDARRSENPEYTKHASTWLNGQCWLDEANPKFTTPRNEPPPKRRNIGDAIRDEARRLGVLKNDANSENRGLHSEGNAGGNVTVLDLAFKPAFKSFG